MNRKKVLGSIIEEDFEDYNARIDKSGKMIESRPETSSKWRKNQVGPKKPDSRFKFNFPRKMKNKKPRNKIQL